MEDYLSYAGAAGSAVSMATTLYFWLVRMRKEKACLKPYLADTEFFLGNSRDGVRQIGLKLGIIVANYSVLPNSILGVRMWVRLQEGWQLVGILTFDKQTPQPFNIPSLQTVLLRLNGTLTFLYQDALEEGSKTTSNYLSGFVVQPLEIKLELRQLNEIVDTHVLKMSKEEATSIRASRTLSSAA